MASIFPPSIVNIGDPISSGSTPQFTALIVDGLGDSILPQQLGSLTLTICDTLTGVIINGVERTNILNVGRGALDAFGNLTLTLQIADTSMDEVPGEALVQRSLILDWTYNGGISAGRFQINFIVVSLAAV